MTDLIKNNIISNFDFLKSSGFQFTEATRQSDVEGVDDIREFVFSKGNIQIKISFYKFQDCNELSITISKIDTKSSFSFEEYLLARSYENYYSYAGETVADYIKRLALKLIDEFESDLKDVLNGKKWIEVPKDYSRIR